MSDFNIGGVVGDTIANIRDKFALHCAYALAPLALSGAVGYLIDQSLSTATQSSPTGRAGIAMSPLYWLNIAISVVASGWAITGIVGSMLQSRGEPGSIGDLVRFSAANTARYVALYIIWYIAFVVGLLLLIVPGLIVVVMFAAAIPAMIALDVGPFQAMQESRQLSKGRRFKIFATLLICLVFLAIPSFAITWAAGGGMAGLLTARQANPLLFAFLSTITGSFSVLVLAAYFVALYRRLDAGFSPKLVDTFT